MDFDAVLHAVESVLSFSILGATGYVLAKKGWFQPESQILLSRLVTLVALPPYLFYNITTSFTREELFSQIHGCVVPFISIGIAILLALLMARFLRIPPGRRGIFCSSFAFSNTIYIGLPVNMALFGEAAVPYALLYYFANTTLFWTLGNYQLTADGEGMAAHFFSLKTLKNIFSPPLCGFLLGLGVLLVNVELPVFLATTARYLGGLTTPLIIMSVGITLHGMGLRAFRLDREIFCICLGRFVIAPMLIAGLSWLIPLPDLMRRVFIIQASLPIMSSLPLLASLYHTDEEYAAVAISVTTLFSLVTIPVFMAIVSYVIV